MGPQPSLKMSAQEFSLTSPLPIRTLEELKLTSSAKRQKPVRTLELFVLVRKELEDQDTLLLSKGINSTESSQASWLKEETSPGAMVRVATPSTVLNSPMKTGSTSTPVQELFLWPTPGRIPTARNSL